MARENLNDIKAFVAVARAASFTRAAAQLGISRSALSHLILALESRLGVRLFARTTRSVSPSEAGQRLLEAVGSRIDEIESAVIQLGSWRDKTAGTVRITAHDHAINTVLWPKLSPLMHQYPDVHIEFAVDYALTDIAAERFDAGVRLGHVVDGDMVALRIAPDLKMAVAGSPEYLRENPAPLVPEDLSSHRCINLRLPTQGGVYAWDFEKDGSAKKVKVYGQITANNTMLLIKGALDGLGLAFAPADLITPHIESGHLVSVLEDWCPVFPGYHLYYASRRHVPPALALVIQALKLPVDEIAS